MKTAKEYWLSKFPESEKDWGKTGHDDKFQVRMMEAYAKYYHQQQVKSVDLADVVGQSEQLKAFREWWNKDNEGVCTTITHKDIDRYLKSL